MRAAVAEHDNANVPRDDWFRRRSEEIARSWQDHAGLALHAPPLLILSAFAAHPNQWGQAERDISEDAYAAARRFSHQLTDNAATNATGTMPHSALGLASEISLDVTVMHAAGGEVSSLTVTRSSGTPSIDEAALRALRESFATDANDLPPAKLQGEKFMTRWQLTATTSVTPPECAFIRSGNDAFEQRRSAHATGLARQQLVPIGCGAAFDVGGIDLPFTSNLSVTARLTAVD